MNVTPSLYALSLYNNACDEILNERTATRRRMLQLIANLALELHITESIKETAVCQRCDGRGTINEGGRMGFSQFGYPDEYIDSSIEDSLDDIEF